MKTFIPFRVERDWAISIDPETKTVRAERGYHPRVSIVEFVAKTIKQAWFAYYNPFEVEGFLANTY
jgi:hypothetical protein